MKKRDLSDLLAKQLDLVKIHYTRERRVCKERRWRIDIALVESPIAIECEGGQWKKSRSVKKIGNTIKIETQKGGRHNTGKGFESDIEKYNQIALSGLWLLRFNAKHIKSGYALNTIEKMIDVLKDIGYEYW